MRTVYSVAEFCQEYGISRSLAYKAMKAGKLKAIKAGKRTLITHAAAHEWLSGLPPQNSTAAHE